MLTENKAMKIMFERDEATRNYRVDKLSEADAKAMLKMMLKINREQLDSGAGSILGETAQTETE